MHCDDVSLPARELVLTNARDSGETTKLLDIHTFTRFFTYQLPTPNDSDANTVKTRFDPRPNHIPTSPGAGTNDLVLRLRASLRSADMDQTQQGMRVSITDEGSGQVVVDGSTEDHDERRVHLDSIAISSSRSYLIKYEFFQKEVGLRSFDDKLQQISAGHMGASSCTKPFVVQELVIAAKELIAHRAKLYRDSKASTKSTTNSTNGLEEHELTSLSERCSFATLGNAGKDLTHGESGLYCPRAAYSYSLAGEAPQELNVIYERTFTVAGAEHEAVTYLFDLTLGFDFATSAQLKAVLQRQHAAAEQHDFVYDPLACLLDHSCVESEQVAKNEVGLDVILTSGDYKLIILDQQENGVRKWLTGDVGLNTVPFTFELQATPVVQNEERVMCGNKLYLAEQFIQSRFIERKAGQRFTFEDDVILSYTNKTQRVYVTPETDMVLKMSVKEAYGVNMGMQLCTKTACAISGTRTGNTNVLFATLKRGTAYYIALDYSSSIIALSSFYDCPHARMKISMMKLEDANRMLKEQKDKPADWLAQRARASDAQLSGIFDTLSRAATIAGAGYLLAEPADIFVYEARSGRGGTQIQSTVLVQRDFAIPKGTERQMLLEVYFDPQFYDIELLIESREASEVRAHLYAGRPNSDISMYKGAKRVFVEAEPGDYTFKIVAKLPGASQDTQALMPKYYEFQLYAVSAQALPSRVLRPPSLNYFGLLGPTGTGFGQLVYLVPEVLLEPRDWLDLELVLSGSQKDDGRGPTVDVQAIETDGQGDQLDISLTELPKAASDDAKGDADPASKVQPQEKHPRSSRYQDDWEDGVTYEALLSTDLHQNTRYRMRLLNRDAAMTARASLKLVVTERYEGSKTGNDAQILPKSFGEVMRVKPKVPGLKESAFIQGSNAVMQAFKVAALQPFVPKSQKVYQGVFRTGAGTDDSFMPSLPFTVSEESAQLYVQVMEFSGREDLFVSVYSADADGGDGTRQVARSTLGKYANALGPVTLTKGKYRLVVHPDQDGAALAASSEVIRFGLDVLLEQSDIGGSGDFDVVVEEVELCSLPALPDNFNGPGFLHPLSGHTLQAAAKYRLAELLEGTAVKFELAAPSVVTFYLELPEGLEAKAALVRNKGTYSTKVTTEDLNHDDETFLRQGGGFEHRKVIQIREYLDAGAYMIKLQGSEAAGAGSRLMPRCEAYAMGLTVTPHSKAVAAFREDEGCADSQYMPEHLAFDEVKGGTLSYPVTEGTTDVAYIDLAGSGEGPFVFFFQIQYDPRIVGVVGLSLSKYDSERARFSQAALWRSPQAGLTQVLAVVESGTYAVGIQTLSSTKAMFQTGGLGSQDGKGAHGKLLQDDCLGVSYTYLVASSLRHDSRTLDGATSLMALLAGGGLEKLVQQHDRDGRLLDELGDPSLLANCPHDDLPAALPRSETGFDRSFTLLVQEKPNDVLDLVIDQESLVRVAIHSSSPKNQVKAYLYENSKTQVAGHDALAWSTGTRVTATLLHTLKPQKRAYRLKLEYDSLDQDDACPTFDLRIIVKPVAEVVKEYLECGAKPLPPASLSVLPPPDVARAVDEFKAAGDYAFSSDFLASSEVDAEGGLEYDIALKWPGADPNADYYVDMETRSDVLTGQLAFTLLYEDANRLLKPLGRSKPAGSAAHGGRFIQRLKLLDREGDLADDVVLAGAVLRLRLPPSSLKLLETLKKGGHVAAGAELCHNFQLSVRAELRGGENEDGSAIVGPSRLVRVRWEGEEVDDGHFDPAARLYATLEFDRSMKAAFQLLKGSEFASLVPEKTVDGSAAKDTPDTVRPAVKKLSAADPSSILLQFPAGSLKRGWCHRLALSGPGLQGGGGGPDFDEQLLASDLVICATPASCHCNWAGTAHCAEGTGICECRWPHIGADCSQCAAGHAKDPGTGRCLPASKCSDLGGAEDCHGHGTCEQVGEAARCTCESGFTHDGLEQCAKCKDPLFEYPDCHQRAWILDEPDVSCKDLEHRMPRALWQGSSGAGNGAAANQGPALQGADGVLDWARRYSLVDGKAARKGSTHHFLVPAGSVFRLLLDTGRSGALARYRLLDPQSAEQLTSVGVEGADADGFLTATSEVTVLHAPKHKKSTEAPFTLQFEYKYAGGSGISAGTHENSCPWIDIHVILEPLMTARAALRCSDTELAKAAEARPSSWEFGSSSRFVNEHVVLRSDDTSLYTHDGKESTAFATLRYRIHVGSSGNALSIVATYPLSSVALSMALVDESTGDVVQLERLSSLEADGDGHSQVLSQVHDTTSFIEVPALAAGQYRLEIAVRRSLFLPTKKWQTCLGFDLVLEYVARTHKAAADDGMYEVLSVRPLTLPQLDETSARVIEVDFDKDVVLDDLVNSSADRLRVCSLVNNGDPKDVIRPKSFQKAQQTLRLSFDFAKATISKTNRCYKLSCSTKDTKGAERILPLAEETSYCFESSQEHDHDALARCNPLAMPKVGHDGRCLCAAPYTGSDCKSCEAGFKAVKEQPSGTGVSHGEGHTRCVVDEDHLSTAACNSHGRPKSTRVSSAADVECACDAGYGGAYCDYCTDASVAYPDCGPALSSAIYNDQAAHAFLARRRYNEHGYSTTAAQYFPEGALEPTVFNEECGWVDFPDDLDRVEFSKEFSSGEFHFADLYVTNHKQDNIIKFIPHSTGVLKVLVQQPEAEELLAGEAEAAFDLELGVYDPEAQKFIASAMNRHLTLPGGRTAKLEYAALTFEATQDHLSRPLYIFFRALNFTDDDGEGHKAADGCLALFLEAEFRSSPSACKQNPVLEASSEIKVLADQSQASVLAEAAVEVGRGKGTSGSEHSVTDPTSTFFAYQDFYLPGGARAGQGDADSIVTVSLQQKFIESNTLDILVEVLESDVALDAISRDAHSPRLSSASSAGARAGPGSPARPQETDGRAQAVQGGLGPTCAGVCLVGGEKSLNEMQRVVEMGAQTYFRVWVFQTTPSSREAESNWCANYQFLVSARDTATESAEKLSKELRCRAEELPSTLDSPRYLRGLDGTQKDFHYRESYRVDHLWHNQAHKVSFTLQEPTVVRVVAPIHRHLEFELVLNQEQGPYSHKTVIRAKREDYHSTIFAQLSAGTYHIKLAFVSDAALLQLPCQTVQLEMAMMTLAHAKSKTLMIKESQAPGAASRLDLQQLLLHSGSGPLPLFKPAAVGWRHVEPGLPPYIDQSELYHEVMREAFEIAEDDEAGLVVEVQSDFLLSGVNLAITNKETGAVMEDERRDSSGKLIIGRLVPGPYLLVLYTHECITNMDPGAGQAISSFDLALKMSVRLLRLSGHGESAALSASVPVELLDDHAEGAGHGVEHVKETSAAQPLVVTAEELGCLKEYLPLPTSLDAYSAMGAVDLSEAFFIGTQSYHSHEISFTPRKGQDALRVLVAKANSKIAVYEQHTKQVVAQSRPVEAGKAQLLITKLQVGTAYTIVLEFSEQAGILETTGPGSCAHFVMALRTWESSKLCTSARIQGNTGALVAVPDGEAQTTTVQLSKKSEKKSLTINVPHGGDHVDLEVFLDYSDTFYRAELTLRTVAGESARAQAASSQPKGSSDSADEADQRRAVMPSSVDFSKKHAVAYLFTDIPGGAYELKLRQRFKESGCGSPVTATVRTWKAASSTLNIDQGGPAGQNLYQSQAEEQERPRAANKLPLNLGTYKFSGGEQAASAAAGVNGGYLLFSGPVQLDERESQNRIAFTVWKAGTVVRLYVEHAGLQLTLSDTSSEHAQVISSGSGAALLRTLAPGSYSIQLGHATAHARKTAELVAPRTQLTVMVADPDAHALYNKTWENAISQCDAGSSFPLALRQQKQADSHQLYYNYPLIKVSPSVLQSSSVLQTYNFRLNVTSRMYLEVGMHLLNSQVTLQLSALQQRGYTIQGKQRGNLNVLDTQLGPGDYSVALKQAVLPSSSSQPTCGLFSLQGLIEPISLMSAAANSGEILQRGIAACPEAADGDILPPQIFASKSATKGGGELHIDANGHFMRRFRDVLFKMSREYSESSPESDRMELAVDQDSLLHLTFLYEAYEANEIRAVLTDTWMLGQQVTPQTSFKVQDIEGDRVELVTEYRLTKGRHYALTVMYIGGPKLNDEGHSKCSVFDLTFSIVHESQLVEEVKCVAGDDIPALSAALPKKITDRDLDSHGEYSFEKVLKLAYPHDFQHVEKTPATQRDRGSARDILRENIEIQLAKNFDISASIEHEYDQAMFTLELAEQVRGGNGELRTDQSHEQSALVFKQNNDRYKSVRRELVADGVESSGQARAHLLTFANQQADILHLIHPGPASDSCLYVSVKIHIKATRRAAQDLYSGQRKHGGAAPTIVGCRPNESPAFVHGRTTEAHFDIRFSTKPYSSGPVRHEEQVDAHLGAHIKLRATLISIPGGVTTHILLEPTRLEQSNKAYQEDEYHVAVTFDLNEYQNAATEKLTHAQLVVEESELVDLDGRKFTLVRKLADAGLPIYVYEQNDMEQLISEESDEVKAGLGRTALGQEADHDDQAGADISTDESDLEHEVDARRRAKAAQAAARTVKCLCVHGKCRQGQATCAQCDSGWKGNYCDVPRSPAQAHVNKNKKRDFTKDGLYRPQQIDDQRLTGRASKKSAKERWSAGSGQGPQGQGEPAAQPEPQSAPAAPADSHLAPKKIEGEPEAAVSLVTQEPEAQPARPAAPPQADSPGWGAALATSSEEGGSSKGSNLLFFALVVFVLYALSGGVQLCPTRTSSQAGKYRPLGEQADGAESDDADEEVADPTARRRMMELSSFAPGSSSRNADATRNSSAAGASESDGSANARSQSSFPMTSFSRAADASSSQQPASANQSLAHGAEDDAAEQLQRELELFAQDDDEEEGSLMPSSQHDQPQNSYQNVAGQNPGQAHARDEDDDENELQEYENFFDQGH